MFAILHELGMFVADRFKSRTAVKRSMSLNAEPKQVESKG
jgi:hypothetical protein